MSTVLCCTCDSGEVAKVVWLPELRVDEWKGIEDQREDDEPGTDMTGHTEVSAVLEMAAEGKGQRGESRVRTRKSCRRWCKVQERAGPRVRCKCSCLEFAVLGEAEVAEVADYHSTVRLVLDEMWQAVGSGGVRCKIGGKRAARGSTGQEARSPGHFRQVSGVLSHLVVGLFNVCFVSPSLLEMLHNGHADALDGAGPLLPMSTATVGLDEAAVVRKLSLSINHQRREVLREVAGSLKFVLTPVTTIRQARLD